MSDTAKQQKNKFGIKYTDDWIPVKSISNGEIILDNKKRTISFSGKIGRVYFNKTTLYTKCDTSWKKYKRSLEQFLGANAEDVLEIV